LSVRERTFLVDSMLGKLAKWLRVMGFDAHYQPVYKLGEIDKLHSGGRLLLTRNSAITSLFRPSLLINADRIKHQLYEVKDKGFLPIDKGKWFSRCLSCNIPLMTVSPKSTHSDIPEYILMRSNTGISHCPSCNRCFWKGSHRKKMINQITEWSLCE